MPIISFDADLFSEAAVKRAAYDLAAKAPLSIARCANTIHLTLPDDKALPESTVRQAVLDHQLRLETEKQYGVIRAILVAQAVAPRTDLDALLAQLEEH